MPDLLEPIPFQVTRFRCTTCPRTSSSRTRTREHMGRCWFNPANRGCMTCIHFRREEDACGCEPGCNWGNSGQSIPEGCAKGVNLDGHPACQRCGGGGFIGSGPDGVDLCPECDNSPDGRDEVKAGPIIHCEQWQPMEAS